ncbi:MAG TPA: tRNA (adenosine(37)-N6)-threonylcarbamoyltransferase complex ATPase subunit type 1 TsaE [Steroidobacteraceae bacterium]|nr:tRNA (adenosine(37)-N6)-threonylcarbamoyltransferase complex ATPase subunit type 1 TsaE [Steroidobacteraceae bacterium]
MRVTTADADATRALGARLANAFLAADEAGAIVVGLSGDLGAGKTTLVGGLLGALGHDGATRSPTYTLVEPYRLAGRDVHHCDLYRLRDPSELDDLGLRDLMTPRSLLLVEWPERAGGRLGAPDLSLVLAYADGGRTAELSAASEAGKRVLALIP